MLKFVRHILSKRKSDTNSVQNTTSTTLDNLRTRVNELHNQEFIKLTLTQRVTSKVNVRTQTIEPIIVELHNLLQLAKNEVKRNKYIDAVPEWFNNPKQLIKYDTYAVVHNNFVTELEITGELYNILTELFIELEKEHNVKFKTYYHTKLSKLYAECIEAISLY